MFLRCLALALILVVCWAANALAAPPEADESQAMVDAINEARAAQGLPVYRHSPALSESSGTFAGSLMRAGVFAHADRIRAGGNFRRLGEALAWHSGGRPLYRPTLRRWLASPTHRELVLSSAYRWVGAARAVGRFGGGRATIWVLQLGGR